MGHGGIVMEEVVVPFVKIRGTTQMTERKSIRLDCRIDIEWLDAVASQVASGSEVQAIRAAMFDLLEGEVSGGNRRGTACYKTIVVLLQTWINVRPDVVDMRDRAAVLLPALSPQERIALHWAMLTAAYSFFGDLAANAGRLLSLQGNFSLVQITRRMRETWGDRSTMTRATQRVIRSMVQWGVLEDTDEKGVYVKAPKPIAVQGELAELILEGFLIQQSTTVPIRQAISHPLFFPFDISFQVNDLRKSCRFEVHRQGLDVDVVGLVPASRTGV